MSSRLLEAGEKVSGYGDLPRGVYFRYDGVGKVMENRGLSDNNR